MHLHADRLLLSPSDVTAFLACEHLTTLSLAHARGEVERPEVDERAGRADLPQGARARARVPRVAPRATGKTIARDRRSTTATGRRRRRATDAGDRERRRRRLPGASSRRAAGAASPTSSMQQPDGTYEALDTKLARSAKPAYILQLRFYNEQLARHPGARARADPRPARLRRAAVLPAGGVRRVLPARPLAARARSSPTRRRPSRTRSTTAAICDFKPSATRTGTRSTTSRRVAGIRRTQIEKLAAAGITTLAALGRAPAEPVPAGINADIWAKIREQAELQLHAREHGATTLPAPRSRSPRPASRSCPTPRPATSSSTSRATRSGTRTAGSSTSGGSSTSTATSRRSTRTTTRRSGSRSSSSSTSSTSGSRATPTCTSTTTPPYEITALKRLMGRYGTRERELDDLLRRDVFVDLLQRRPQRRPRLAAGLRAEGARGLPRLRARRRR